MHDIDFLAAQLLNHRLHPRAFHPDAGAHRIDILIVGNHGNLGPPARLTCCAFDFNDAFVDLRNFLREELISIPGWVRDSTICGPRLVISTLTI